MALVVLVGCGNPFNPFGPAGDGDGSGSASDSGPGASEDDGVDDTTGTGPEPTGGGESGDADQCTPDDVLTGLLLSSTSDRSFSIASDLVLDGTESGGFYVARNCVARHDGRGVELWSVAGEGCHHLAVSPSGNPVVAGRISVTSEEDYEYARVTQFDSQGAQLWVHEWDVPGVREAATDVAVDGEGNVLVAGRNVVDGTLSGWVAKLSPMGTLLWTQTLPGMSSDAPKLGVDDAGFVYAADTVFVDDDLVHVTQLAANGDIQWSWETHGPDGEFELDAMGVNPGGQVLIAGRGPGNGAAGLYLLDAAGDLVWSRTSHDVDWIERAAAVVFEPCGTIALAGAGDPGASNWGQLWVAKISTAGDLLWSQYIDGPFHSFEFGQGDDRVFGIDVDHRGVVTATGMLTVDKELFGDVVTDVREQWFGWYAP